MKKNRRKCANCNKQILDIDFRRVNLCQQCGSSFCSECAVDQLISTTKRYICKKCLNTNYEEELIERAILIKGW